MSDTKPIDPSASGATAASAGNAGDTGTPADPRAVGLTAADAGARSGDRPISHPAIERAKRFLNAPTMGKPRAETVMAVKIIDDLLAMADDAVEYFTPDSATVRCNNLTIEIEGGRAKITIDGHEIRGIREFDLRMAVKSLPVFHFTTLPIVTKEQTQTG